MHTVGIIGDSHTMFFDSVDHKTHGYTADITTIPGATARGFSRLDTGSTLNLKEAGFFKNCDTFDLHLYCFGQIDVELGYYYRRYVKGSTLSLQEDLASVYEAYIRKLKEVSVGKKALVKQINQTALRSDEHVRSYVTRNLTRNLVEKPAEHVVAAMERDKVTLKRHSLQNESAAQLLGSIASDYGVPVLSLRDFFSGYLPGRVHRRFLAPKPDVHVRHSSEVYAGHIKLLQSAVAEHL